MFQSQKPVNVAPIGTVGTPVRTNLSRTVKTRHLLGVLPLVALSLTLSGKPALAAPSVTVMPGNTGGYTHGMPVAVVSATEANGDVGAARRALAAANAAIGHWPGYVAVPPGAVASALSHLNLHGELVAPDYQNIGKRVKAQRLIAITLVPGMANDTSANYTAIAEMYDTVTGGLVGRGQTPFTATAETLTGPKTGTMTADTYRDSAIDNAVQGAILALNEPAPLHGIVVSLPAAYQARLSMGERQGIRNGARIEYMVNGQTVAYGTVFDVGPGDAVASIASEASAPMIGLNTEFRTVSNPSLARAGMTAQQIEDKTWRRFERDFVISAIPALAYQYYLYGF